MTKLKYYQIDTDGLVDFLDLQTGVLPNILTNFADLDAVDGNIPYFTAAETFGLATSTSFGRDLLNKTLSDISGYLGLESGALKIASNLADLSNRPQALLNLGIPFESIPVDEWSNSSMPLWTDDGFFTEFSTTASGRDLLKLSPSHNTNNLAFRNLNNYFTTEQRVSGKITTIKDGLEGILDGFDLWLGNFHLASNGYSSMDIISPSDLMRFRIGAYNVAGIDDAFGQYVVNNPSGWGYLENWGGLGMILGSSSGPVQIRPSRGLYYEFDTTKMSFYNGAYIQFANTLGPKINFYSDNYYIGIDGLNLKLAVPNAAKISFNHADVERSYIDQNGLSIPTGNVFTSGSPHQNTQQLRLNFTNNLYNVTGHSGSLNTLNLLTTSGASADWPLNAIVIMKPTGAMPRVYQLESGTSGTVPSFSTVRPNDYHVTLNPKYWNSISLG